MAGLYGKALAKTIPASTTGTQAQAIFGAQRTSIAHAQATLSAYSSGFSIGQGDAIAASQQYLGDITQMLDRYEPGFTNTEQPISDLQLVQLRACVSTASVMCRFIDENFATSYLQELSDAIVEILATFAARAAKAGADVFGSFVGGSWWIWVATGLGIVFYFALKKGAQPS